MPASVLPAGATGLPTIYLIVMRVKGASPVEYLLSKITIPDRTHTDEQRLPGEKRADFLRRIYG